MAEFKISSLRFTWRGPWADGVDYNRDAVVQYEGKTYVCLQPHTSTNFYDDLTYSTLEGGELPRWSLMADGRAWKQAWEPDTYYFFGNIVTYGGAVYICTEQHTSGSAQIDLTKWTTYSRFDKWDSNWNTSAVYGVGDIVRYGGIVYRCVQDHVSASSIALGLEDDQAKWEIVNNGLEYKGNWVTTTRYKANDLVRSGTDIYKCTVGHTSSTLIDGAKFELWFPGMEFKDGWSSLVVYQPGDIVMYGGYSYICKTVNAQNIIPSVSSGDWDLVTQGYNLRQVWNSGTSYKVGDVVLHGGNLFSAIADSASKDPTDLTVSTTYAVAGSNGASIQVADTSGIIQGMTVVGAGFSRGQSVISVEDATTVTLSEGPDYTLIDGQVLDFVGINTPYWSLVVPSAKWMNFWESNVSYVAGEIVSWQNVTYRCIKGHVSSSTFRPDTDTSNALWVVFIKHAVENAGNTLGDLVSYNNGAPEAIHILPEGGTVGDTEDYLLRLSGTRPNWTKMFIIPDVFYVAPTGVDRLDYGRTWDQPWKTVKYACKQVEDGFFYQIANDLLVNNKEFLIEEMYQWMLYQKKNNLAPFTTASVFNEAATRRDAKFIIDSLSHDIIRGSNSRTVTAARQYFKENSNQTFFNQATDDAQAYIVASLEYLKIIVADVVDGNTPTVNYQNLKITWSSSITYQTDDVVYNDVDGLYYISLVDNNTAALDDVDSWAETTAPVDIIQQYKPMVVAETNARLELNSLFDIVIYAITNATTDKLPRINAGATATIFIKTGTYSEQLPIVVPDNTALVGDELRGTVIQPEKSVYTSTKSCSSLTNRFTLQSVEGLELGMPIQFSADTINDDFGNIALGTTYYVASIIGKTVGIATEPGGNILELVTGIGFMTVYAGDCLKNMFFMRNSTGLRNMSLTGLAGSLGYPNSFTTRRPTGGAYVSLDPGTGPDDTRTWIISRSPYCQNVTNFGVGCVGMKIDGLLHNGGFRSMVANDFTQILSDGIGIWVTGPSSLTECVSVFCYYNYAGYFAEDGGRIRATNGNSSYGTYGVVAEGFDSTEIPISGVVDNRSSQVQASVQSAFGTSAELLSLEFTNAGSNYYEETTNLLKNSNLFTSVWTTDGNVTIQKNTTSPFGETDAWTLTGNTSSSATSYIYQNLSVLPPGSTYSNVAALNVIGSGIAASFDVTVTATGYTAIVNNGGSGYVIGGELRIPGSTFGGKDGANDCFFSITSLAGSAILGVDVSGTVPTNTDQNFTFSVYAKQGTAPSFDIDAIFSGSSSVTSSMTYTFATGAFTTSAGAGAALPVSTGKLELTNGWNRIWFTVYDKTAQNTALQIRIWPRGKSGLSGNTRFYGTQLQLSSNPTFYLETTSNQFTSNANFTVTGSGTGAELLGNETRSNAVFETRITDTGTGVGGRGYLVASNNAQGGDDTNIILAGSDTNLETNYVGMRVFIESGTGAGQYGYISAFDSELTKTAQVLRESFAPLKVTTTDNGTSILTMDTGFNTSTLYLNQRVQFIPTYYTTTVTTTGIDTMTVTTVIGGSTNTMTVDNTAKLVVNMPIKFSGSVYGGVTSNFTYFVREILDATTFTISTEIFGTQWLLNSGSGNMTMSFPGYNNEVSGTTANMQINMPIHFTGLSIGGITVGTAYYVNEVIDENTFTISSTLVQLDVTGTSTGTNYLTTSGSTAQLVPLNPIKFSGTTFGNVVADTVYYINKVVNLSTFTITSSIIETQASATETLTNLITVGSTAGFVANNPIQFIGRTTGGIVNGTTYYILAINDSTTFTISTSPGGSAVNLSTSDCDVLVRTTPAAFTLATDTGSMSATSTNAKTVLTGAYGSMNGTYNTNLFGNVEKGTTYYVKTIDSSNTFTVSETLGGSPLTLKSDSGSMNVAAVGWDHIHPGTVIETQLDNSSIYYVEPRIEYSKPFFTQNTTTVNTAAAGTTWSNIAYGNNKFIAIPDGNAIAGISEDGGTTWTAMSLPLSLSWSGIAYGDRRWVAISSGGVTSSVAMYSINDGEGWNMTSMPSISTWDQIAYGNGKFVAIASSSNKAAYSTNYGKTWVAGSGLANANWSSIAYGEGKFVAIASGGTSAAYSTNGINWISTVLPSSSTWSGVAYGNGLFVAVSSAGAKPAYSQDGITWSQSPYTLVSVDNVTYGQGVFVAGSNTSGNAYTTEDGVTWTLRSIDSSSFNAVAFGWNPTTKDGVFVSVGGTTSGSIVKAGSTSKARVNVTSGVIQNITMFEPGSNYTIAPTIVITDPNVTLNATTTVRMSNGVLSNPTFISSGQDYNTNSTVVKINGGGYADTFQAGLRLIVKQLSALPAAGDDLVVGNDPTVYKVTKATVVYGTVAPNIMANIEISPEMTVAKSPDHETPVTIRVKYSQCRLTGHDFLNVGYGNIKQSNYPNLPQDTVLAPQDQAVEVNYGRVFYTSTDQDGNFKVGTLFGVEQATGIVTLSATQFGLTGLETLSLGGIAVGSQSVVIRQFSTDSTFIANSNEIIPTQRAIKAYLTSRLSQGGANTFTGQLTAGTVVVGGADKIRSTIPEGNAGWVVNVPVTTRVHGQFAGWDGDGAALAYFMKSFNRR